MTTAKQLPVLIIGAGISGLTLARLLSHHSIPYAIFESSHRLSRQGHGITARAWAYDPLLAELGVSATEFKSKAAADCAVGGDGKVDRTLYEVATGKPLVQTVPRTNTQSPQSDLFRANRNLLRGFLMEGVDVQFEHELIGVEFHGEEQQRYILARFKNGETAKGICLVGADGVHSFGTSFRSSGELYANRCR